MPYKTLNTKNSMAISETDADGNVHMDPASLGLYLDKDRYVAQTIRTDRWTEYGVNKAAAIYRLATDAIGQEIVKALESYVDRNRTLDDIVYEAYRTILEHSADIEEEVVEDLKPMIIEQIDAYIKHDNGGE